MAYFNYRNLDSTEFEALAKDVMERLLGCRLFRYGPGTDRGIDLCNDNKRIVVQCKRYQQGSFDKLYSVLKREEKPNLDKLDPKPEQYYVFTSLELLPQQKQKILDLFQEYMEGESCIIDGIVINDFFRDEQNHDLVSRNIKLFLSFPENYKYSAADFSQVEANRLYDRLFRIFENDRKNHPSIRMMNPDPLLFPKGLPEILSDGRLAVEKKNEPQAIRDMMLGGWKREDRRHILLVGEGGIGKTVAMLTLPEEDWFKKLGIPVIYVPLQRLDAYEGDLNRYIKEKIGSDNYELCINLAHGFPEGHPSLLLLLDGFNEIPDKFKKKAELYIRGWMEKPGIQIITTSRLGFFLEKRFSKYRLQPLLYDTVRSFLLSAGIVEGKIPRQNDRICEVINIPLMLTMYTQIEKVKEMANSSPAAPVLEWKEPENAAHIIWDYMQLELYRCIEKCIGKDDSSYSIMEYAVSILAIAPYVCSQMSRLNKFYLKRAEFHELIRNALIFYTAHEDLLDSQIMNVREEFVPHHQDPLFWEGNSVGYARILIDNMGLFQTQKISKKEHGKKVIIDYCFLMHQNFRDAFAAFFICSCIPKARSAKEKRALLGQADYYVKDYMAEHLSDRELVSIWDRHRQEDPEDGHITFIILDIIGRQRNYDYRNLDFSYVDLTVTNMHWLLSRRLDICPLSSDGRKFEYTKIAFNTFSPHSCRGGVNSVSYSPDGRHLAIGSDDKKVLIWDMESGESHLFEGHKGKVTSVAYSPDGKFLASGDSDGKIWIWDLVCNKSYILGEHGCSVNSVAYSPDGKFLASGDSEGKVWIWNLVCEEIRVLKDHEGEIRSVVFSPDGIHLAAGGANNVVLLWNLVSGDNRSLGGFEWGVNSVTFSPDGSQLAFGGFEGMIRVYDFARKVSYMLGDYNYVNIINGLAYSPDGMYLVSGSFNRNVQIWDLESEKYRMLGGYEDGVRSVAYSPDGAHIASGANDGNIRIRNLESEESYVLEISTGRVRSVAFSPDGKHFAWGGTDRTIRICDLGNEEYCVLECQAMVEEIIFSPDGKHLASGTSDGKIRTYNLENGKSSVLTGYPYCDRGLAYSPDGRYLAYGTRDDMVQIWDLEKDDCIEIQVGYGDVSSVVFSPDGRYLAGVVRSERVKILDLESRKSIELQGPTNYVTSVAYSPDGRFLVGAERDKFRIWNLENGEIYVSSHHIDIINRITYSPDMEHLISFLDYGKVCIWNMERGDIYELEIPVTVENVDCSPDGKYLICGACGDTVIIWDIEEDRELKRYTSISHLNICGANFENAIIGEADKEILRAAGARV